jgi:hypothetical protein
MDQNLGSNGLDIILSAKEVRAIYENEIPVFLKFEIKDKETLTT